MNMRSAHVMGTLILTGFWTVPIEAQTRRGSGEAESKPARLLKAPETPAELWDAVRFSLNVGRPEDALDYLGRLLASDIPPELLIEIRERDAATVFPKLAASPLLREQGAELMHQADRAARARARDPERIEKFIGYLTRTGEHRAYGLAQLRAAGADAVPHLLAALKNPTLGEHHAAILQAMTKLDTSAIPPLVAALDSENYAERGDVISVLGAIGTRDTVPHLRYAAEALELPDGIRARARQAVERILGRDYADLPAAPDALVAEVRRYYAHRVDLAVSTAGTVRLWRWVPREGLRAEEVSPSYAEEYFGLEHAEHALTLAPDHEQAQILLVSLALEKDAERVGIDQPLPAGPGRAFSVALRAGPDLMSKVLVQALRENRPAVAGGAVRALGETGDSHLLAAGSGSASPLLQALAAPDRRIQFAAAEAIVRIRPQQPYPGTSLVVPILARALETDAKPRALVIDYDATRAGALAALLDQLGYEARSVTGAREGFAMVAESAGYELVFMEPNIQDPTLSPALASFRSDARTAAVPIALTGEPALENELGKFERRYRHVRFFLRPTSLELLKLQLDRWLADLESKPLTNAERSELARRAAGWLERIARGEMRGLDARAAEPALLTVLNDEVLGPHAVAAVSFLPSPRCQAALANLTLDGSAPPAVRLAAATYLGTSMRQLGLLLTNGQLQDVAELTEQTNEPLLHDALTAALGSAKPSSRLVGERLRRYTVQLFQPAATTEVPARERAAPPPDEPAPAAGSADAIAPAEPMK